MKLDRKTLESIARGVVRVEENDGYFSLLRFTKEQEELYKGVSKDFYTKTFATAGIVLDFVTDSKTLTVKAELAPSASRTYYSFDIFVDGKEHAHIDNFSGVEIEKSYSSQKFEIKPIDTTVDLGDGEKRVSVYMPWSVSVKFGEISLDDGAKVLPCEKRKKMLVFGDSITHGYDSMRPCGHYVHKICDTLGYEQINKGIGAEIYRPELARLAEPYQPDVVMVVYGTNDWNLCTKEQFTANCQGFLEALSENYKDARIVVLSPIWRKNFTDVKPFGSFFDVEKVQSEIVSNIENAVLISGFDLVPHDCDMFGDLRLHPNDKGFEYYGENLLKKIRDII